MKRCMLDTGQSRACPHEAELYSAQAQRCVTIDRTEIMPLKRVCAGIEKAINRVAPINSRFMADIPFECCALLKGLATDLERNLGRVRRTVKFVAR